MLIKKYDLKTKYAIGYTRCLLCLSVYGTHNRWICDACTTDLPWLTKPHCTLCSLPTNNEQLLCTNCLNIKPKFSNVHSPWTYSFPIDVLIKQFKHHKKLAVGHMLNDLLAQFLHENLIGDDMKSDLLIPVPITAKRRRLRGFNQTELMAKWLSHSLNIPSKINILNKIKDTPSQQRLTAEERAQNMYDAFFINKKHIHYIYNKHIALIDDVLTTGATANSIALLLKQEGASRVDIYCLARTPTPTLTKKLNKNK